MIKPNGKNVIEFLEVSALLIDRSYQRETIKEKIVQQIASDFDWAKFGTLQIGRRKDGTLWVIDGMHRREAALRLEISRVPCSVCDSGGAKDEASRFVESNNIRTRVSQIDEARAWIATEDDDSFVFAELCKKYKITITGVKQSEKDFWTVQAASALRCIFNAGRLESVLSLLLDVRSDSGLRQAIYSNTMLYMTSELFNKDRWNETPSRERICVKLKEMSFSQWKRLEQDSSGSSGGRGLKIATAFIDRYYNKGLRSNRVEPKSKP